MEQTAIEAMLAPPKLTDSRRILAIQPHPDDNEIAMGGTLARLAAQGTQIVYLTVTNGDRGGRDASVPPAEVARIRAKELEAAGRCLGVQTFYGLNLPDGGPLDEHQVAVMIAGVIRRVKPDTVLCPDPWLPYEGHADHRKTGLAAVEAFMNAGAAHYPRGAEYEPFAPQAIGFYFTARPNQVVDVTDFMEKKFEAIALHRSQVDEDLLALYRAYFTQKGRELAQGKGFEVGEGFKLLRPVHLHCFVDAERI